MAYNSYLTTFHIIDYNNFRHILQTIKFNSIKLWTDCTNEVIYNVNKANLGSDYCSHKTY